MINILSESDWISVFMPWISSSTTSFLLTIATIFSSTSAICVDNGFNTEWISSKVSKIAYQKKRKVNFLIDPILLSGTLFSNSKLWLVSWLTLVIRFATSGIKIRWPWIVEWLVSAGSWKMLVAGFLSIFSTILVFWSIKNLTSALSSAFSSLIRCILYFLRKIIIRPIN